VKDDSGSNSEEEAPVSVRRVKNHGKWVWQARVAYRGLRKAAFRDSKEAARDAEGELLRELKA
jgi:hypothetical protein